VEVAGTRRLEAVAAQVARMFSLDVDARAYPEVGAREPRVGALMCAHRGLRPVLFASPYEAAAWAVLSQRISMSQAARLQDRLIAAHGAHLMVAGEPIGCFPSPAELAALDSFPGLTAEKSARLRAVAAAALDGRLDAARLRALGDEAGPASLRTIRGIGPFWSQGIYLRACGVTDAFPYEPHAVEALGRLVRRGRNPPPATVARLTEAYRPFRMWVCFLLRVNASRSLPA